jgi:hypothetical protein
MGAARGHAAALLCAAASPVSSFSGMYPPDEPTRGLFPLGGPCWRSSPTHLLQGVREFQRRWVARPEVFEGRGALGLPSTPFSKPQGVPHGIPGHPRLLTKALLGPSPGHSAKITIFDFSSCAATLQLLWRHTAVCEQHWADAVGPPGPSPIDPRGPLC